MGDISNEVYNIVIIIPAILIAFTFHEYAHAFVADKLGDRTPRFQGRLTLNPLAHIDPIGFILILIVHFGWAKPVETNPSAYKNYNRDDLKVSIAGPLANVAVAFIFAFITIGLFKVLPYGSLENIIVQIANQVVLLNCTFSLLNLIPIPGFDGFHILRDLFPKAFYNISDSLYRYQLIIFIVLAIPLFGTNSILGLIIGIPGDAMYKIFMNMAQLVIR
jgi:Zn-dependent protease